MSDSFNGWTIAAKMEHPHGAHAGEDGALKVDSTWDILLVHDDGRRELFEACYFGANVSNMLQWCAEQATMRALKRAETEAAVTFQKALAAAGATEVTG